MTQSTKQTILLGDHLGLEDLVAVARYGAKVEFSASYKDRVNKARSLVEKWVLEGRVMYGVTTGFGALCNQAISAEDTAALQKNIILSHSVSVGEPLPTEQVRAILFMVLQNLGQGHSGVRLCVLEFYRDLLNHHVTPWVPGSGSVGYLSPEAHMAMTLTGDGKAYFDGQLMPAVQALEKVGLTPMTLASKEGLALVSGTTSTTALGALALYDMIQAAKTADIIGAMTLEASGGILKAFDPRVMSVRPHPHQEAAAANVRFVLDQSEYLESHQQDRVQDALSLRCIPQLHGAARKTLEDARATLEIEINSCCDNPIIWWKPGEEEVISACNADSSYVGLEMDSAAMAATLLGKMSERRNNRLIDSSLSGLPWFLIKNPGLNSGLMIPQYTQAGLLNEMRTLCHPATIDNTPTCGNQEDYVAMGYYASKKAISVAEKLQYILAIELLSVFEAQTFLEPSLKRGLASGHILAALSKEITKGEGDRFLYPDICRLKEMIHTGQILHLAEEKIGDVK